MTIGKEIWPADGADHSNLDRTVIFENAEIKTFLDSDHITVIAASKGMGKTLLLRVKKNLLHQHPDGMLIIPHSQEYDEPKIYGDISVGYAGFNDIKFWRDLWKKSIVFSILSYMDFTDETVQKNLLGYVEKLELNKQFKSDLSKELISKAANNPSYYLGQLLKNSLREVEQGRRNNMHIVQEISKQFIGNGVCIFIDAFDQTLTEYFSDDLTKWKNAQLGLVHAGHHLNTENSHIKLYVTIRQEAFAGLEHDDSEVIKGRTIRLEYTDRELKRIFLSAIKRYSNKDSVEGFLGINKVFNKYYEIEEVPFDYIYRHTTGSPRSLMMMGKRLQSVNMDWLSEEEKNEDVIDFVDRVSKEHVCIDYLNQKSIFLKCINSKDKLEKLMELVCSNVMNKNSISEITKKMSEMNGAEEIHPFCELYNIGLLGRLKIASTGKEKRIFFRKPYEFSWKQKDMIRDNATYFLHPGICSLAMEVSNDFFVNESVIVGSGIILPKNWTSV
jgi:hypothetical protein